MTRCLREDDDGQAKNNEDADFSVVRPLSSNSYWAYYRFEHVAVDCGILGHADHEKPV